MRRTVAIAAVAALLASLSAATAGARTQSMSLTCRVGGRTTVGHITVQKASFRFRWWYANGSTYRAPVVAWYTAGISKGKMSVRTHGTPTRAMAVEHLPSGHLVRIKAACS